MTTVIRKLQVQSEPHEKPHLFIEAIGWQVRVQSHVWSPPTDLFEVDTAYVIRVEIAGMRQQEFSIHLDNEYLVIKGRRLFGSQERRAYHQMEVRFGEFSTALVIPSQVDLENATAEYDDGFLIITIPKISIR